MLTAERHELSIDIDNDYRCDRGMAQDLAQRGSFAAAADQDTPGVGMGDHRRMHQQFVIDILVDFGGLNLSVDDQTPAQVVELLNDHILVGRLRAGHDPPTAVSMNLRFGVAIVEPQPFQRKLCQWRSFPIGHASLLGWSTQSSQSTQSTYIPSGQ